MAGTEELDSLYRTAVLDHSRSPRNFRRLALASHQATGHNPLCGDKVTVYLQLNIDGRIGDAAFEATGCAISMASASMLTELVHGRNRAEAGDLIHGVETMLSGGAVDHRLGEVIGLCGVRTYPSRVRCATLPWRTLQAALRDESAPVSTENGI